MPRAKTERPTLRRALLAFVETIDATGGVRCDDHGYTIPVADEDWIDLGEAYELACAALGRKLVLADDDEDEQEGDASP